ncbi:MAG TPA: CDP-alcohol phosphatidyltransferase family protein [Terriglobales bacterium]|nr:CDP-alcohol phosphatidyltransferase family protein [Terriglobales bacterium]
MLERTVLTAQRAGATDVLLIWPQSMPLKRIKSLFASPRLRKTGKIRVLPVEGFDPNELSTWTSLQGHLEDRFIWLPWNWVTYPRALANLPEVDLEAPNWHTPTRLVKATLLSPPSPNPTSRPLSMPEGVAVTSAKSADAAERFLVVHSGKVLDGIHTSFNRRMCRPVVRWLSHTRVTPNAVTLAGVVVSVFSGFAFARGNYWSCVAGALLCYIAGLFDEMDGMLARIKFADSPFGTWLEGFADGLSYLFLFGGITVGLYRQYGRYELWVGAALLIGTVLSVAITSLGRKRATSADRPNEYLGKLYQRMEEDSSNWISRAARQAQAFQKRGVMIIYVVIFTVLGGLPVLFYLATLGSHLTWTLSLYFSHRFFKQSTPQISLREIPSSQGAL